MKKVLLLLVFIINASCELHESTSRVFENELLKSLPLKAEERVIQAFLWEDYRSLKSYLDSSVDVNVTFSTGKNLLVMAIEKVNFRMINFLLENRADPKFELVGKLGTYRPVDLLEDIDDESLKKALEVFLLEGINSVASFVYYYELNLLKATDTISLDWYHKILENSVDHSRLKRKTFEKLYLGKVARTKNFQAFLNLLVEVSDIPTISWQSWLDLPFSKGKYKKAQCDFIKRRDCETFTSFISTCKSRYHKILKRYESKISQVLDFRNALLKCERQSR